MTPPCHGLTPCHGDVLIPASATVAVAVLRAIVAVHALAQRKSQLCAALVSVGPLGPFTDARYDRGGLAIQNAPCLGVAPRALAARKGLAAARGQQRRQDQSLHSSKVAIGRIGVSVSAHSTGTEQPACSETQRFHGGFSWPP